VPFQPEFIVLTTQSAWQALNHTKRMVNLLPVRRACGAADRPAGGRQVNIEYSTLYYAPYK